MEFVTTLIASDKPLTIAHLAGVTSYLDSQGIDLSDDPIWLKPNKAADLYTAVRPNPGQVRAIRDLIAADRIDVLFNRSKGRKKKLLLADMDATIVQTETLDELAGFIGKKEETAEITERTMRGELDFSTSLRERVGLLKDLPEDVLRQTMDDTKLSLGAELLVGGMREKGAICVLVSGGFTYFTGAVAKMVGFHHHHGNTLEIGDGKLLGTVAEPILDKNAKLSFLRQYMAELGLAPEEVMAIGDGANDILMLETAGLGIGYRPKPLLVERLDNLILYGDLTAALYAQGLVPNIH
ncbi:MAG: Phosphoserine phosphatase [Micavibrio sp.]|nr:Phosphoserine phosphatase [Micavibrio sp.]